LDSQETAERNAPKGCITSFRVETYHYWISYYYRLEV